MLTEYIQAAMRKASYEFLQNDELYYGEVPGLDGVYASHRNLEDCREELRKVLEDWILLSIQKNLPVPVIDTA